MPAQQTVLFLGSSTLYHPRTSPEESLTALTHQELARRLPGVEWRTVVEPLFYAPNMSQRAQAALDRYHPDAVFLSPSVSRFVNEASVRYLERWSIVGKPARWGVLALRALAGGGYEGSPTARGLIFRGPRSLARRFVQPRPWVSREEALAYTLDTLRVLVAAEDVALVCRLPVLAVPALSTTAERYRGLIRVYNTAVAAYCDEKHVLHYDLAAHIAAAHHSPVVERDLVHFGLPTRRFESRFAAEALLEALDLAPVPPPPPAREQPSIR